MNIRTDLAVEAKEIFSLSEKDGFIEEEKIFNGIKVSRAEIASKEAEEITGKAQGHYTTVFFDGAFSDDEVFENAVEVTANELKRLIGDKPGCVLSVGLGNEDLTADALGPKIVDGIIVTRHLKDMPEIYDQMGLAEVSALKPGVLGKTGIESADLIKAAVEKTNPSTVLVFDSLASRRMNRLCATVQMTDTGISPGSGVGNRRAEINKSMGVPVICVGVPTVVDAATLTADTLQSAAEKLEEPTRREIEHLTDNGSGKIREALSSYENNLIVTPRDIDTLVSRCSRLLSLAVNKALHGDLSQEEISALLGN